MIKIVILALACIVLTSAVTYQEFDIMTKLTCANYTTTCDFNFYESPQVGDEEVECARDIQRAKVCFSSYKQCYPSDLKDGWNEELPVVCWQCYMGMDSDSTNFNKYVSCLQSKGGSYLVYTLLLLVALMFMA